VIWYAQRWQTSVTLPQGNLCAHISLSASSYGLRSSIKTHQPTLSSLNMALKSYAILSIHVLKLLSTDLLEMRLSSSITVHQLAHNIVEILCHETPIQTTVQTQIQWTTYHILWCCLSEIQTDSQHNNWKPPTFSNSGHGRVLRFTSHSGLVDKFIITHVKFIHWLTDWLPFIKTWKNARSAIYKIIKISPFSTKLFKKEKGDVLSGPQWNLQSIWEAKHNQLT